MRTIIAGSRSCTEYREVHKAMAHAGWRVSCVLSGTAQGADQLGEEWAEIHGIPVERYPANWKRYGLSAGYKRNIQMSLSAEALVALWDGKSKGTEHMIDIALKKGLVVLVWRIESASVQKPRKVVGL